MLTVLLQVRYHREEGKCRAGAHGPGSQRRRTRSGSSNSSGSNEGNTRGGRGGRTCTGGMNGAPGTVQTRTSKHEVSAGSMNKRGRVQTSTEGMNGAPQTVQMRTSEHRGRTGGSNEHMGYERSTRDGTNEHEVSAGSTNERRRVRTSAGGYERARGKCGGLNKRAQGVRT